MEQCTVETGFLKKKPCGLPAVAKCANCERGLCVKHAVVQMSAGKKTFLCEECAKAWKRSEKAVKPRPGAPAGAPQPARRPAPAAAPARPPAAPAAKKPEPPVEHSGPLEFTPEPKKPEDKK